VKEKLIIILSFVLMAILLVGLNAASYTRKDTAPDTEAEPNRSTFNPGPTGAQAFYALLAETGRNVSRWQRSADDLNPGKKDLPSTLVMIGPMKRELEESEITVILKWVANGGRLVLVDREPPADLLTTTANWKVEVAGNNGLAVFDVDPADAASMTASTPAAKPVQPSLFSAGVNAVQTSKFASSIKLERFLDVPGPQRSKVREPEAADDDEVPETDAPVVHVAGHGRNVLVDMPFGHGQIVMLSDPFVTSNSGIAMVDNAQLAVNLVTGTGGTIAFDEYHHGYGDNNNRFLEFFAGTPVVAIFFQCAFLLGLVFYSRSSRFARPIPEYEPDRLSKLEYVGAMAELQRRTKAYDLAVENVYKDFHRRAARLLGVDSGSVKRGDLAALISERTGLGRVEIEGLLVKCEEIMVGEPTNKKEVVELIGRIRGLEHALGLRRAARK